MNNMNIPKGSTEVLGSVDGDLFLSDGARVKAKDSEKVEVNVDVDKKVSIGKNLSVEDMNVGGNIWIGGNTEAGEVTVGGYFESYGDVTVTKIDVGGR